MSKGTTQKEEKPMDKRMNPSGHEGRQKQMSSSENESVQAKKAKGMDQTQSPSKPEARNSDDRRR